MTNKIIYYVATSLDGYIAGVDNDISRFAQEGNGVQKYLQDLQSFQTVIMGRNTYEFGYEFGLQPGQPAYPHMQHFIFSNTLKFTNSHDSIHVESLDVVRIQTIREQSPTDVYLCGGGIFAGWLLDHGLIDQLKLKINPIILGGGVKLFGASTTAINLKLTESEIFENGLQIATYDIQPKVTRQK